MNMGLSRWSTGMLVIAAVVMMSSRCWAIREGLGPSKDEWGMKYDVAIHDADGDKLTIVFTLADEGRLKPFDSIELVVFSKQTDSQGGRSYDVLERIELKATKDGKREGQVQVRKDFADRAHFRIITHRVDGQQKPSGGAYYNIPLAKYRNQAPVAASSDSAPPAARSASKAK